MSHNARRSFLAGFPTLAALAGVAPRLEAPRTPGRDLERLRLCAQFVNAVHIPFGRVRFDVPEKYGPEWALGAGRESRFC